MKKQVGRPRKVKNADVVKTVRRNVINSELIDNLLIQESIIRNMSINAVMTDIFTQHFTNNTLQFKYLKAILSELTRKKGSGITDELLNINAFDKLLISENEIKASKYTREKKYKKKFNKPIEEDSGGIDIFNLDSLKKK